jgi:hypothetical protein
MCPRGGFIPLQDLVGALATLGRALDESAVRMRRLEYSKVRELQPGAELKGPVGRRRPLLRNERIDKWSPGVQFRARRRQWLRSFGCLQV